MAKRTNDGRRAEYAMHKLIDEKSQFEEFKEEILPKIRAMLKAGKTSVEIRAFTQAYVTARQVSIALGSVDEGAALKAIDSLTHQNEGKPKERSENIHKFERLPENELDAILASKLAELSDSEKKESH